MYVPTEILIKHNASGDNIGEKILSITRRFLAFDENLCTEAFLQELDKVLPDSTLRGKLNTHASDTEEELALLHPADRFLVEVMKISHISDRVKGMRLKVNFHETYNTIKEVSRISSMHSLLSLWLTTLHRLSQNCSMLASH